VWVGVVLVVRVWWFVVLRLWGVLLMSWWLTPEAQKIMYYSPFVHSMELMRYGIFGDRVNAQWDVSVPLAASAIFFLIGLALCRRVRRVLVVE
jgi:capsular polysaccharide transport system permease protein